MGWLWKPFFGGPDRITLSILAIILSIGVQYFKVFTFFEPLERLIIFIGFKTVPTFDTNSFGSILLGIMTYFVIFIIVRVIQKYAP